MRALLIQNEKAGDGATSPKKLCKAIRKAGWKVSWVAHDEADAKTIAARKPALVVVAGGDGTVAEIARILPDRRVPLAVIPSGTANNIARSLGICGDHKALIADWEMNRRLRLDIGQVIGPRGCRRFVEGVGFGAFAEALARVEACDDGEDCPDGREALSEALAGAEPLPLDISIDGAPLSEAPLMLEVMNIAMTGPRLPLAPDSRPGEGMLHVCWLPSDRREAMIGWLADERGDPPLVRRKAREIALAGVASMRIDDETCMLAPGEDLLVRIESEPIQVLAPCGAPALAG